MADGRLIYSLAEAAPRAVVSADTTPRAGALDTNLWEIKVDAVSGTPVSRPSRITNWSEFSLAGPNTSADNHRLVFGRMSVQADVYVSELQRGGRRLKAPPRRLTLDERNDGPHAWTPDSKAVLLTSDRSGNNDIYKQALDQYSAEPLVGTGQTELSPRLSPDGAWVVYVSFGRSADIGTSAPAQLRRVPVSGGPSELVLTAHGWTNHRCARAPASLCLVGEQSEDKKQLVLTAFDPLKGRGHEVIRTAIDSRLDAVNWDLSPDGSHVAMLVPTEVNHIRLLPIAGARRTTYL